MLQIPETKIQGINYLQESFLRKSKGQIAPDHGYYNLLRDKVSSFPFQVNVFMYMSFRRPMRKHFPCLKS